MRKRFNNQSATQEALELKKGFKGQQANHFLNSNLKSYLNEWQDKKN